MEVPADVVLCFSRLLCHADLSQPQLATLALNLWNLAQKHGYGNTKYTVSTGAFTQNNCYRTLHT